MEGHTSFNIEPSSEINNPSLGKKQNFLKRMKQSAGNTLMFTCVVLLLLLIIIALLAIPISQIILGSLYKNSCPMNNHIPLYLILAGIGLLIYLILIMFEDSVKKSMFLKLLHLLVGLVCLGWLITGSVWIFPAKNIVQYDNPNKQSTYCQYSVFTGAYITNIISYGVLIGGLWHNIKQ